MKVLDAANNELHVGDRVERLFNVNGWVTGGKAGEVHEIEAGGRVWVTWNKQMQLRSVFEATRKLSLPRSFTCPDLLLCPEGSE